MKGQNNYKTEYGRKLDSIVKETDMSEYYDDMMGVLRIPESDNVGVMKALEFIKVCARNDMDFAIEYNPYIGIDGEEDGERFYCVREVEPYC